MSYGQSTLQVGETLHFIGFPALVRLGAHRLQIQLANGCLSIEGRGMDFLLRDLLAGSLAGVQVGRNGFGVNVDRVSVTASVVEETEPFRVGESCPVADDLILLEGETSKDYLAHSELTFFGRLGRPNSHFVLGFRDRSYRIKALPEQADALCAAVMAARFTRGSANTFTTLMREYFMPWAGVYRHEVTFIEETEHRPQDWSSTLFAATLHLGASVAGESISVQSLSTGRSELSERPDL